MEETENNKNKNQNKNKKEDKKNKNKNINNKVENNSSKEKKGAEKCEFVAINSTDLSSSFVLTLFVSLVFFS